MIEMLILPGRDRELRRRVTLADLAAPEIFDLEVANVLRILVHLGRLADREAGQLLRQLVRSPVERAPHKPLMRRIWELRGSVRPYDAAYVALAELLDVPLITCDAKLAGSNGHNVKFELYIPS